MFGNNAGLANLGNPFLSQTTTTQNKPSLTTSFAPTTNLFGGAAPTTTTPTFGAPSATPTFGAAPATTTPSLFGATPAFGAKPAATTPTFGAAPATTTTPSLFGGFGTTATNPASTTPSFGTTPSTYATSVPSSNLFGAPTQPTQQQQPQITQETRYSELPANVQQWLTNIRKMMLEQRAAYEELSQRTTSHISAIKPGVEKCMATLESLRRVVEGDQDIVLTLISQIGADLREAENALRSADKIRHYIALPLTSPSPFFQKLVQSFDQRIQQYKKIVLELQGSLLRNEEVNSNVSLQQLMKTQHSLFFDVTARVAALHEQVELCKENYLKYRRHYYEDEGETFSVSHTNSLEDRETRRREVFAKLLPLSGNTKSSSSYASTLVLPMGTPTQNFQTPNPYPTQTLTATPTLTPVSTNLFGAPTTPSTPSLFATPTPTLTPAPTANPTTPSLFGLSNTLAPTTSNITGNKNPLTASMDNLSSPDTRRKSKSR
eukprot:TRINITY_DN1839_c0_g3_i1.p1 TRINITY_DN1839_c0_g3~~TRINITY_DN1839_c0_g3_i1.p1  ORF type:complete len:491 (+),score=129.39 TRINITY_DN1839_c0_g3_i1:115-1587(+)